MRLIILIICAFLLASLAYSAGQAIFDPGGAERNHNAIVNSMTE